MQKAGIAAALVLLGTVAAFPITQRNEGDIALKGYQNTDDKIWRRAPDEPDSVRITGDDTGSVRITRDIDFGGKTSLDMRGTRVTEVDEGSDTDSVRITEDNRDMI